MAQFANTAYVAAFSMENVIAGFQKTGIHPFNRNTFTEDDFLTSFVTDRLMPELRDAEVTTDDAHGLGAKIPSTVDAPPTSADILSTSPSQTTGSVSNPSTMVLCPECVRPYPKALSRKNTQNRSKKMKSTVITDTPEKDALMEKRLAKKKINKKNNKLKTSKNIKKLAQSSSESSDSDFSLRESDDSDGSTYNLPPSSKASSSKASTSKAKGKPKQRKTQKNNNNKTDNYCIVCKGRASVCHL